MFQSDTSVFGDKATPWDTGFARRFLKISDEEKKLLENIPGWSTEKMEENQGCLSGDERNVLKLPNPQNISETEKTDKQLKSIETPNAEVLSKVSAGCIESPNTSDHTKVSTAIYETSSADCLLKAYTARCTESPNISNIIKFSTENCIESPNTGSILKASSASSLESRNKNTFMQSISLYAKKVISVFSGIHRKRSKSLSDIHRAKCDVAMKLSKSETNLNDDSNEREIAQSAFNNGESFRKIGNSDVKFFNTDERAQTVDNKGLDLNCVEGNRVVKNVEIASTFDRVEVAELLNSVNRFFQISKETEGNETLRNIGLNSIPCPPNTTDHEIALKQQANIFESDPSLSIKDGTMEPDSELEEKQKNQPNKCLPDLICNGSLVNFSKDVTMEKKEDSSQSPERPTDNFKTLSNGSWSKKNIPQVFEGSTDNLVISPKDATIDNNFPQCLDKPTGNLHSVASEDVAGCHPVIIHVSPCKSSISVSSPKKIANLTSIPEANLPPIECEEIALKTTNGNNFVIDDVHEEERNASIELFQTQKQDLKPANDVNMVLCDENQVKSVKTAINTSLALNDANVKDNLSSVHCDTRPNKVINTSNSTLHFANGEGNLPSIAAKSFNSTGNVLNNVICNQRPSLSNCDLSSKNTTKTQYASSQERTEKVLEDKDLIIYRFDQTKEVGTMKTKTDSSDTQNYRKSSVGTVSEPCGMSTVENYSVESQENICIINVNKLNQTNSVALDGPKMHLHDPNSIDVVDLTESSSHVYILENASKAGTANQLSTKRKRQSKDASKPRKKTSFSRLQVQIQYSGDELRNMIHLMKVFQSGIMR